MSFELQRLVPCARSTRSSSATESPREAASRATPAPVTPPPATTTSTRPAATAPRSLARRSEFSAPARRATLVDGPAGSTRQTVAMPEQPELTIQGWGPAEPATGDTVPKAARRHLARELGWTPRPTPPVPVDDIVLTPPRLPDDVRTVLVGLLGEENV